MVAASGRVRLGVSSVVGGVCRWWVGGVCGVEGVEETMVLYLWMCTRTCPWRVV